MEKILLRQALISQLKELNPLDKQIRDLRLEDKFLANKIYQESQIVALFLSMPFEVNTEKLIQEGLREGKQILVPRTAPRGQMDFVPYNPDSLGLSSFGILEPTKGCAVDKNTIDLILVPGLAWNKKGYRIGFGGGFYDRYLADFKGRTLSLCYDFQLLDFESECHDVPVEEVITDESYSR